MNTTLVRSPGLNRHEPPAPAPVAANLRLAGRLELRLGLWLLLRSARRLDAAGDSAANGSRLANARAQADRRDAAFRALALGSVRT